MTRAKYLARLDAELSNRPTSRAIRRHRDTVAAMEEDHFQVHFRYCHTASLERQGRKKQRLLNRYA